MLTIPKVAGLAELLSVFCKKMREMGIGIRVSDSKTDFRITFAQDDSLGAGRAISRTLKQVLEYCFQRSCHFNVAGQATLGARIERPELSTDDIVYVLYNKWQRKIKKDLV